MSKYIDAEKLKRHYAWWDDEAKKIFDEIIDLQPAADVVEVRHGKWEWNNKDEYFYSCSNCGHEAYGNTAEIASGFYNYCPRCGAKMVNEDDTD